MDIRIEIISELVHPGINFGIIPISCEAIYTNPNNSSDSSYLFVTASVAIETGYFFLCPPVNNFKPINFARLTCSNPTGASARHPHYRFSWLVSDGLGGWDTPVDSHICNVYDSAGVGLVNVKLHIFPQAQIIFHTYPLSSASSLCEVEGTGETIITKDGENIYFDYDSHAIQTLIIKAPSSSPSSSSFIFDKWVDETWEGGANILNFKSATTEISNINLVASGGILTLGAYFAHIPVEVSFLIEYERGALQNTANPTIEANGNIFTANDISTGNNKMYLDYGTKIPIVADCKRNTSDNIMVDNGFHISKWIGTNLPESEATASSLYQELTFTPTIDTTSNGGGGISVTAIFIPNENPITASLITNSNFGGTIDLNPPGGKYTIFPRRQEVILTPLATPYYTFDRWEYSPDSNITKIKDNKLQVIMDGEKTVSAVFRQMSQEEIDLVTIKSYYCPSSTISSNIVDYTYTNSTGDSQTLHFRANFYNNLFKENIISSSFSLFDQKRWFIKTASTTTPFPADGIVVSNEESVRIQFVPDVFPIENSEKQGKKVIDRFNLTEKSLLCGIKYFVDLETYDTNSVFEIISSTQMIIKCSNVNMNNWRENKDKNNWYCSGTGKQDLLVSNTASQSINPSISANIYDKFIIVWQSLRETANPIYTAIWDSEKDVLYGGGQGLPERKVLSSGAYPKVITDQAQNFYISSYTSESILANKCSFPKIKPYTPVSNVFNDLCYPGYASIINPSLRDIKMRVYKPDSTGSIVINENKVVSVVEKENIRLDIAGIPGAYAVALRNSSDNDWGDWISINGQLTNLPDSSSSTLSLLPFNSSLTAYSIDTDRFIVPFTIPKINGVRRICCQVLTFYGISKTICIDVFVNLNLVEYDISFFTDSDRTKSVPSYNGCPVLSSNNLKVYIKVAFNEPQTENLKFNVVQQGIFNQSNYNLSLEAVDTTHMMYHGEFNIRENDGIFNKDGIAFINIVFPYDLSGTASNCLSDDSDKFNLMLMDNDLAKYKNDFNTNSYKYYETRKILKTLNVNEFLKYYSKDDEKGIFGNPKFYLRE